MTATTVKTLQKAVEALAAKHGWRWERWSVASTGSRYTTLERTAPRADGTTILDVFGDEIPNIQTLNVRVANHPSKYNTEDISISLVQGHHDHTLEILERVLMREFVPDDAD